jgi:hypothetical protein
VNKTLLKFGNGNAKLAKSISTFSLPAGYSCPFAYLCLSKASPSAGKITDGPHTQFRCFAASQEILYPNVRESRWHNFNILKKTKTVKSMAAIIHASLPHENSLIRVHVSGDFFSEQYFLAWLNVALNNNAIIFYGYTKALPFLVKFKKFIPHNFRFTASKGGTHDHLIAKHHLKFAEVVYSVNEALEKGLEIDHDDSHAISNTKSFALLLHGIQPKGTPANEAWLKIKRTIGGYSKANKRHGLIHLPPLTIQLSVNKGKIVKTPTYA